MERGGRWSISKQWWYAGKGCVGAYYAGRGVGVGCRGVSVVTDPCRRWKEEAKGRRQACGRALGGTGTEGGRRLYDCTLKAKTRCAGMSTQHARIAVDPRREKTAVASVMEESVLISGAVKEVWLEVMVGEKGLVVCGSNVAALNARIR